MLYFLYGTDTEKARKKLHSFLNMAKEKRPDAEVFRLTSENWNEATFDELLISRGLFEAKYTVILDNLFEKKEIKDFVLERLESVAKSEQIFFLIEPRVDAPIVKKVSKYAKQTQEFTKGELKPEGSIFSITDGLVSKDKKKLWISYLDFLEKGIGPEEIHGIFFWQVKNMILVAKSKNPADTGLSPFVYRNASLGAKKYSEKELMTMSSQLVDMTHRVRQGKGDLDVMLEKWILTI